MIKKVILTGLFLTGSLYVKAQSHIGYLTDNYSGVNSVISNPSNIVDSYFRTDINLAGFSTFFGNDYYETKTTDVFKNNFDFDSDGTKSPTEENNMALNVDILGPSFMFNLNKESSIAVFTRARAFTNINSINGETFDKVEDDFNENTDYKITEGDFYASANSWAEIGVSYARVLLDKEQHFLKGGISLKYLKGIGNIYVTGKNVTVDYDADGTDLGGGVTTGEINSSGRITYATADNYEAKNYKYELPKKSVGFGTDLGFTYEWRPDYAGDKTANTDSDVYSDKDKNKYKLKLGLSLTDLGAITYKNAKGNGYDITKSVSDQDIENQDGLLNVLNNLYTKISTVNNIRTSLPTALHLNADWSFNKCFYLNLNTDFSVTSKKKENTNSIANVVSLTPRYESKWFGFYLPISMVQYNGFQVGAGLRAGPLYIGSGSLITAITGKKSKGGDVYAGIKIPLYKSKTKDRDGDGVLDKVDDCPKIAGPIENNGCPWKDTDGDTVLDNEDLCIEVAGPLENKGCPWKDTDGDTLLDNVDNCPEVAGPTENNGCPFKDTDNDGVLDQDDLCIDVVGTVANKGCPEIEAKVTEAIQKTLNQYAKTILFNPGKSSIKAESTAVLVDIMEILKEYPNANFVIEGHTDSIGSAVTNQRLSETRAKSVEQFLIERGINSARLTSKGYGEKKPIATNMYKAGRAQNRRVEINLVK